MSQISKKTAAENAPYQPAEELYQALFEQAVDGIFIADEQGNYVEVNQHGCEMLGYTREEILSLSMKDLIPANDLAHDPLQLNALRTGKTLLKERYLRCKNGRLLSVEIRAQILADGRFLGMVRDITEHKQAEEERLAHLRFFENMDQVNRAMQGTNDLEQMMRDVLDVVLTIFDCDRAGLVYPCDPEAASWHVPVERTRPEYPGALALGVKIPTDSNVAQTFRIMRNSNGPVRFDPESEYPLPPEAAERFGFKSFIAMALYPKVGQPWELVLHQCSYPRVWTVQEERLFQEIGRRLADALTSLLVYRNLQESEEQYRLIAENTVDTISIFDLNLKPVYVSPSVFKLRGYTVDEAMSQSLDQILTPESLQKVNKVFTEQLALEASGKADPARTILLELEQYHKDGSTIWVELAASAIRDNNLQLTGILTVSRDITKRRQAEDELQQNRAAALRFSEQLATLQEITNELSRAESSDNLCRLAVQLGRSRLGFDRVSIWFIEEHLGIMRGSFGTNEHGELRDERDAQVEFKHEGLAWRLFSHNEPMALVERVPLYDHLGRGVGEGDSAMASLWDGDKVIGVICVDNLITGQSIRERQLEVLRLYATALAHLITRKQAEEALRASEARFRILVDHAADAFYLHDAKSTILDVNRQACVSLGYSREELVGMNPDNFDVGFDHSQLDQVETRLDAGEVIAFDTRHRRKDGTVFPVEVRVRPFWQGKHRFVVSLARDITDRKQAEMERERLLAQIREQAQQVQNIIDTVPEGVVLLSQDLFVTLTNPVGRQYLTLLASDWENGRLTHLGQRPLHELLTSPPKGLWHEIVSDDLAFETIARPVENGPQNSGWVLVLRDVTQERGIQQRVQRQDRLAAVGQLAAGIAHDFNNILAVVALYIQLISRTVEMPPRTREQLHTIDQQIKRATDLIQQILDFSRQSVLDRQPLDLLPFMEKLVTLLERTLPEHIQIELDYAADAYFIQADPTRMQQVMMNLAVNARDAMPEGGRLKFGLVHVQTKESKLMSVQELPPGDWIQIEATDTGSGIPPEALSNIFEPFFTTKKEGQGTGLGLAQVYGIIQQHEGYIDVATEVGKGTTFSLYFPALDPGDNTTSTPDRTALQLGQGQKVLVVEDEPDTRMALVESLALLNYEIMEATNGREALAILAAKADEVELVLSDVVMPEMGGAALFYAMREQNLNIPVVLLTGHPLSKEMESLQALGIAGWLQKPPDLVNLSYFLAEVLTASDH